MDGRSSGAKLLHDNDLKKQNFAKLGQKYLSGDEEN